MFISPITQPHRHPTSPTPMPVPAPPEFTHENQGIHNFVNMHLSNANANANVNIPNRSCLIIMSGIMLNNVALIKYAADIDPTVVNTPVPTAVHQVIEGIFGPAKHEKPQ